MVHIPVLLKEAIEYLDLKPGDQIIDATLGGGGHASAIVEKIAPDGKVLGIELDRELLKEFKVKIQNSKFKNNVMLVNDSYANVKKICREYNFKPNGILFDLGLSSWHYERSGRGFSFKREEPLDMRFAEGKEKILTAAGIINTYSKEELEKILREYGEEQFSQSIADNIVKARKEKPIMTTGDLVEAIRYSVPDWYKKRKIHFATKTFQALRIKVNSELDNVSKGVSDAIDVLEPKGRLVVISFHGLEDKIAKEIFKKKTKEGIVRFVVKGTVKPKWEEVKNNPRARSAKLKVIEKA
ncbi:MAG: 16S rRNA (cytosine(1402)-N(4))-methyltransferase RsmH [Patescibacteria group bacterium]